ncbi:hypothetical protein V8F33_003040 [Rhypophila sp. PSN 637]
MPLGEKTNLTADPSLHTDQRPDSPPSPSNTEPIVLPRTRRPGSYVETMPRYRSPCHSPVLVIQSPSKHMGYKHAEFSFESPPASPEPDITILPDTGGLAIRPAHYITARRDGSGNFEASDPQSPQMRSASSSYPSEGMRSPAMSASPPMTFSRRVFSNLEAYGFSSAYFSFLQSSESSTPGFKSANETQVASEDARRPDEADNHVWDFLSAKRDPSKKVAPAEEVVLTDIAHHEREETEIGPEDEHPGHKSFDDLARSVSQKSIFDVKLPNSFPRRGKELRSTTMSLMTRRLRSSINNPDASTICLPRASGSMEKARPEDVDDSIPHVEHCSNVSARNSSDTVEQSSSGKKPESPRRCGLRTRISHYFQLRQTVKVKKWIVNKFFGGRKGSHVVVRKVKQRKARFVVGGSKASSSSRGSKGTVGIRENQDLPAPLFHGGFYEDKKKSGSLSKSIRSIRKSVSGSLFGSGSVAGATRAGSGVLGGTGRSGRVGKSRC